MNSKQFSKITVACCSALVLAAAPAILAQSDMSNNSASMASPMDKHFVKEALMGGMAEVQLGQIAAQKASSDDVKQFGQKMVDDHTKLGDQMKTVAGQVGVTPPTSVSPKDQALMTKLQGLSGEDFDKAYIRAMLKDHEQDLKEFKKESADGKSSDVKDAAGKGEQVIQMHLDMIKSIAEKHHVTANGAAVASM